MINRTVLVGRLTKDPIHKQTPTGVSVANFTLAVNRTFTGSNGERQADFINCVAFNKTADNVSRFVHKGSLVGVEGRIQTRNYENPQGQRVYVTEVVCDSVQFLEPKKDSQNNNVNVNNYADLGQNYAPPQNNNSSSKGIDLTDDDLPF